MLISKDYSSPLPGVGGVTSVEAKGSNVKQLRVMFRLGQRTKNICSMILMTCGEAGSTGTRNYGIHRKLQGAVRALCNGPLGAMICKPHLPVVRNNTRRPSGLRTI